MRFEVWGLVEFNGWGLVLAEKFYSSYIFFSRIKVINSYIRYVFVILETNY
jgi:hypothetical protein